MEGFSIASYVSCCQVRGFLQRAHPRGFSIASFVSCCQVRRFLQGSPPSGSITASFVSGYFKSLHFYKVASTGFGIASSSLAASQLVQFYELCLGGV